MERDNRPSEVYRFQPDYTWEGIEIRRYKPEAGGWEGIVRQVITGWGHETGFHVRYFEIAPGGYSSLEKHGHAHVVIALRGEGVAIAGDRKVELRPFDVLYLKPWEPHQFVNGAAEPFGFLCIVDGERDRPQPVSAEEAAWIRACPETAAWVREEAPTFTRES